MEFLKENGLTVGWIIFMLVVGGIFFHRPFVKKVNEDPTQEYDEPQGIASLGVLGTFIGISWGLWWFDSADIEASVPFLLGGMRTAFITSVFGMSWSMWLKYKQNSKEKEYYQQQVKVNTDATIGELIAYFKDRDMKNHEQEELVKQYQQNLIKSIQEINKSLVGDGDSSVITQVQLIKGKMQDSLQQSQKAHEELIKEFRDFAKTMTENNAKAFIEALNQTIHDFNEKIQEQFGENFKQLNVAVGKLLEWQEEYKNTVIEVTKNQKEIFSGINDAKESLGEMAVHGDSIKNSAKQLGDILVTIDKYQQEIEQSLNDLQTIGSAAKEMVPNIKSLADETCGNINTICERANKELNDSSALAVEKAKDFYQTVGEKLVSSTEDMKNNYADVTKEMRVVGETIAEVGQQTFKSVQDNGANIEKISVESVQAVDKQMQDVSCALSDTVNAMLKVISAYEKEVENISQKSIEIIKGASDRLQNSALEVTQRISDNLAKISEDNNEELKKQQKNMANSFEEAMSKALYAFGNEMAKISQKFADDYNPLADKLREVLRIAEQAQRHGNRG